MEGEWSDNDAPARTISGSGHASGVPPAGEAASSSVLGSAAGGAGSSNEAASLSQSASPQQQETGIAGSEQVSHQTTPRQRGQSFQSTSPSLEPGVAGLSVDEILLDPARQRFSAVPEEDYNSLPTFPIRPSYKDFHAQLRPASQPVVFDGCPDNPYRPASVPIYQTATFVQPSSIEFGSYDYSRSGNPTRTALEKQVAMLENAHAAFAFTTGMAALSSVTRLVDAGSTIVVGSDIYGGMHRLVSRVTSLHGVTVKFVETWDLDAVRELLENDASIQLLHMETPSNPLMRITDIRALADILHEYGVLLCVDSTMMTPYLQKPLNHGADVVVHSLTKFFGGTSDVSGGITCVANEELAQRIAFFQNAEGSPLAPFDCWLFLRGIKTLAIRVERAQENAAHIAAFLNRHPLVKELYYAGLEPSREAMRSHSQSARDFKVHMSQARGGGSLISFTTGSVSLSRRIIDSLRLFKLTVSFGSCNSLCEMPSTLSHASIPAAERTLPDDLVRISIGIEDANDLLEDLQQAFALAASGQQMKSGSGSESFHTARTQPSLPTKPQKSTPSRQKPKYRASMTSAIKSDHGDHKIIPLVAASFLGGIAITLLLQMTKR
mmetsp:Transcript_5375/g.9663  ORF Transcript_5375/g.9663 Transcript_5375/m.9663 type:complete len:608 (-) Transcript_5375:134-1957(-)